MLKRGLIFFVAFFLLFSFPFVIAQEERVNAQPDLGDDFVTEEPDGRIETSEEENQLERFEGDPAEGTDSEDEEFDDDFSGNQLDSGESSAVDLEKIEEEFSDDELEITDAGSVPGDTFYFLDEFFSFGDQSEERASEIIALIESGASEEEIRRAFDNYKKDAEALENADPDSRREIRRRAAAIHKKFKERRGENDFVNNVLEQEGKIVTAVEISSKRKELCTTLADLDPEQFYKTCKTENDSPDWQKKFFDKLTNQQKKEAEQFINVISECFESPANCNCEASTNIQSFVNQCRIIAEAEAKCRNGDDTACEVADEVGDEIFDSLSSAPHLQNALELIERKFDDFNGDRFDNHIPPECRKEGATDRKSCEQIMIRIHSPQECITALDNGEIKFENERQYRDVCERVMFETNAPEECIDEGINNFKECGKFMFNQNAPEECIEAGLTGENQRDHRKCEEIMKNIDSPDFRGRGPGPDFGRCMSITEKDEKLRCFEKAAQAGFEHFDNKGSGNFEDRFRETKERERQCSQKCSEQNSAWDFSNGRCVCHSSDEFREDFSDDFPREIEDKFREERDFENDLREFEGEPSHEDDSGVRSLPPPDDEFNPEIGGSNPEPGEGGIGTKESEEAEKSSDTSGTTGSTSTTTGSTSGTTGSTSTSSGSTSTTTGSTSGTTGSTSTSSGSTSSGSTSTGSVIFTGNAFLDYYYR
jgi:hypothetical protein